MNKIILGQLQQVTSTKIDFTTTSTEIYIPKTVKILNSSMKIGGVYDIELKDSIMYQNPSSTLASNWNNGQIPAYKKYTVEVVGSLANMIHLNGVAIENNASQFYGWLPNDGFTILKKY